MQKRFMEVSKTRRQLVFEFEENMFTKEEVVEFYELVKHFAIQYHQNELALKVSVGRHP